MEEPARGSVAMILRVMIKYLFKMISLRYRIVRWSIVEADRLLIVVVLLEFGLSLKSIILRNNMIQKSRRH